MNILNRNFKYVPAASTDIRKTFARVRKQMQKSQEAIRKVTPIKERRRG